MNAGTVSTISTLLGMVNPLFGIAASVAGNFMSDQKAEKLNAVSSKLQDAVKLGTAVMPLLQQAADGKEVTEDDVRSALAGMDDKLDSFEEMIKAKGG